MPRIRRGLFTTNLTSTILQPMLHPFRSLPSFNCYFILITLLSSLFIRTGFTENSTALNPHQIFHEAPSSLRRQSTVPLSRSCWFGREVSASFDEPLPQNYLLTSASTTTRSFITVCPSLRIKCHGRVASWRTTLTIADRNSINFAIFRSTHDASGQRFTMVGYNTFSANQIGRTVFDVPESKRLAVEPGDIFGYFRMGSGDSEFIGFVNVEGKMEHFPHMLQSHSKPHVVSGNYDSCYQLPMTYIDLIKSNYKITIDSNAVLLRRLYSLAAVIEASNETDSAIETKLDTKETISPEEQIFAKLRYDASTRARIRGRARNARFFGGPVPQPVSPMQRWRQYITAASSTTTTETPVDDMGLWDQIDNESSPLFLSMTASARHRLRFRSNNQRRPTTKRLPSSTTTKHLAAKRVGAAARSASDPDDRGLQWCGDPPTIENSYSVNEIIPQIRLPTRTYYCQSGYTPVGFNRVYCDASARRWTPVTFQCVFTIVMEDPATRTIPTENSFTRAPPPAAQRQPAAVDQNTCLFPPVIDNGYAIRQDEITVLYRCYPGFLKVGQVDQDSSSCDRVMNTWTPPLVSCVLGRNTVTIPLNPPTVAPPPIFIQPQPRPEVLVMPQLPTTPRPPFFQTLPAILLPPRPAAPAPQFQPQLPIPRPEPFVPFATVTIPLDVRPVTQRPAPSIIVAAPQQPQPPPFFIPPQPPMPQLPPLIPTAPPQQLPQGPLPTNVMDCGLPPRIANGRYYQDPDPYYPAKSYIYECYPGYVMRGQPVVFCNPYYGRFTQLTARCDPMGLEVTTATPRPTTQLPQDQLFDCGTPPPIGNAFTVTGGRRSSAVYLCLPGYTGVGIAEIQCIAPLPDDDPGRGPTWSQTAFQCISTSQMTTPTTTTTTRRTTTTTTPEPTTEYPPFMIIPGPRRTPPAPSTTTTTPAPATWFPMIMTRPPWLPPPPPPPPQNIPVFQQPPPAPASPPFIIPNVGPAPPFLMPNIGAPPPNVGSVELITPPQIFFPPPAQTRPTESWLPFETLQPTRPRQTPPTLPPMPPAPTRDIFTTIPDIQWLTPSSNNAANDDGSLAADGKCPVFQTCGEPPQVANAAPEPSFSGRHSCPGDYVRFVCEPGYKLDSLISAVFCSQATYSWSPARPPVCLKSA